MNIIEELSKNTELIKEETIFEMAKEKYNMDEEEVKKILEFLKRRGEIYSPRFGYYQLI